MFFRNGWNGDGMGENYNSRSIATLQDTINTNHNNDLVLQGIHGNASAITELASTFGTSNAIMQGAINEVKNAVDRVAATSGITGERVINSVILGNKDLTSALQSCCCENKLLVTNMGYQNQLGQKDIQYTMTRSIDGLNNNMEHHFATGNYERAAQTCDIKNNIEHSTSVIVDKLNQMENRSLQDKINELTETKTALMGQISQEQQNQQIAAMIAPIKAELAAVKAAQPATTTVQYPQLTVVPNYLTYGTNFYNNNGFWA